MVNERVGVRLLHAVLPPQRATVHIRMAQDISLPRSLRPALPTALLSVERVIPFFAPFEHGLRCRLEVRDFSEEGLEETGDPNVHRSQLLLQHVIYVFAVFGGVCEAARVEQPWRL